MVNTVRIKRRESGAIGAPSALRSGELAFNEVDNKLYYGFGDSGGNALSFPVIAGGGMFGMEYIAGSGDTDYAATLKDFADLSGYRELILFYQSLIGTDGQDPFLQFSTDNGSSFLSGATEYNNFRRITSTTTTFGATAQAALYLDGFQGVGNVTSEGISGFIHIFEFNTPSVIKRYIGDSFFRNASGVGFSAHIFGDTTNSTACNAIRFDIASGNIGGSFNLWGVRG